MFLLLGGWFLFRNKPAGPYFLTPGVLLVVFGLVAPRSLKIAYIAWMSLAFIIGLLVSAVVVTIFTFGHHPYRDWGRLFGKDFLSEKLAPNATSY